MLHFFSHHNHSNALEFPTRKNWFSFSAFVHAVTIHLQATARVYPALNVHMMEQWQIED